MNYRDMLSSPVIPPQIVPLIEKASQSCVPVFIQGEKGTGKELVAKIIHQLGQWKNYRFHRIDCKGLADGTLPHPLAQIFKEVDTLLVPITLYLKDVGDLGQRDQLKLLEIMEDGIFQDGVEKKAVKNLRFITSHSESLKEKVSQGKFLEELYHRIRTVSITIAPLRDRTREIPAIAQYVLKEQVQKINIKKVEMSPGVLALFRNYRWPENLREMEHVIVRSAIFSEGEILTEKDLLLGFENEKDSFISFLRQAEVSPPPSTEKGFPEDRQAQSLMIFFIELIHRIKNPLVSIKTFTQLLGEKFNDVEFRDCFYRIVTEDIDKIDSVLNGLLNYIKINTPIQKTDTIHVILEEILKTFEGRLEKRKIKVFRKYEKDLPETSIHDEQLRYMISSILHYAFPTIPPDGSIGFMTKTWDAAKGALEGAGEVQRIGQFVELVVVFSGTKQGADPLEPLFGVSSDENGEGIELELRLVREMVEKHRGRMKFEMNEKKPRTLISLKFPVERRKVVSYPSING